MKTSITNFHNFLVRNNLKKSQEIKQKNEEIIHYKRECLILSGALYDACILLNDKEHLTIFQSLIEENRKEIQQLNDCCIEDLIKKGEPTND
jgi:hypothetical protein